LRLTVNIDKQDMIKEYKATILKNPNHTYSGGIVPVMSYSIMMVFVFIFGLIVGSFLNVCIYRIPLKKSIINPPSGCPGCGERIKFYDNIPILSYIILGGKCRRCRQSISVKYPFIELLTGLLNIAVFVKYYPDYLLYFAVLIFVSALVVISFIDLSHQIIPDVISIPGIIAGFAVTVGLSFISSYPITWIDSLIGIIAGGGMLYLVAVIFEKLTGKEGMGGGDIKLLAMIGAWMGWRSLPLIILSSSLAGCVLGAAALLLSGKGLRARIPFGPFLVIGALIYLFFGRRIETFYFQLFM
jgi:leader peptidase (prepilin peptidase) / N-methyltransferase